MDHKGDAVTDDQVFKWMAAVMFALTVLACGWLTVTWFGWLDETVEVAT